MYHPIDFNTCSIFNYTISHTLGTASLPFSVNNYWGSSRQQCLYSYFFVVSKDILNKQILPSTEKPPTTDSKLDSRNQAYDSFMQSPSFLGVVEAIPPVRSSPDSLSYEDELTVCFVKEPNSSEGSALSLHLSRRLNCQRKSCFSNNW